MPKPTTAGDVFVNRVSETTGIPVPVASFGLKTLEFINPEATKASDIILYGGTAQGLEIQQKQAQDKAFGDSIAGQIKDQQKFDALEGINQTLLPFKTFAQRPENQGVPEEQLRLQYENEMRARTEGMASNPFLSFAYNRLAEVTGLNADSVAAAENQGRMAKNIAKRSQKNGNSQGYLHGAEAATNLFNEWEWEQDEQGNPVYNNTGKRKGNWNHRKFNTADFGGFDQEAVTGLAATLTEQEDYFSGVTAFKDDSGQLQDAVKRLQQTVKSYAEALAPLKDIFGNDMDKIVATLEEVSGHKISTLGSIRASAIANTVANAVANGDFQMTDIKSSADLMQKRLDSSANKGKLSVAQQGAAMEMGLNFLKAMGGGKLNPYQQQDDSAATVAKWASDVQQSTGATASTATIVGYKQKLEKQAEADKEAVRRNTKLTQKQRDEQIKQIDRKLTSDKENAAMAVAEQVQERVRGGMSVIRAQQEVGGWRSQQDIAAMQADKDWNNSVGQGATLALSVHGRGITRKNLERMYNRSAALHKALGYTSKKDIQEGRKVFGRMLDMRAEEGGADIMNISDPEQRVAALKAARDSGRFQSLKGLSDADIEAMNKMATYAGNNTQMNKLMTTYQAGSNVMAKERENLKVAKKRENFNRMGKFFAEEGRELLEFLVSGTTTVDQALEAGMSSGGLQLDESDPEVAQEAKSAVAAVVQAMGNSFGKEAEDRERARIDDQIRKAKEKRMELIKNGKTTEDAEVKDLSMQIADMEDTKKNLSATFKQQRADRFKQLMDRSQDPAMQADPVYAESKSRLEDLKKMDTSKMSKEQKAAHEAAIKDATARMSIALNGQSASLQAVDNMTFRDASGKKLSGEEAAEKQRELQSKIAADPSKASEIVQDAYMSEAMKASDKDVKALYKEYVTQRDRAGEVGTSGMGEFINDAKKRFSGDASKLAALEKLASIGDKANKATTSKESKEAARNAEMAEKQAKLIDMAIQYFERANNTHYPEKKDESSKPRIPLNGFMG